MPPPPTKLSKAAPLTAWAATDHTRPKYYYAASNLQAENEPLANVLQNWMAETPRESGYLRITTVPKMTTPVQMTESACNYQPLERSRLAKNGFRARAVVPTLECDEDINPLYDMSYSDALLRGRVGGRVVGTPISALF